GVPGGRRDGPAARQQVLVLPHRFGRPALVHGPVAHLDDEVGVRVSGGGSEGQLFVPAGLQLALRGEVVAHVVGPAVVRVGAGAEDDDPGVLVGVQAQAGVGDAAQQPVVLVGPALGPGRGAGGQPGADAVLGLAGGVEAQV